MLATRHNLNAGGRADLTLSEVAPNATCRFCGVGFTARRSTAQYCGNTCRQAADRRRRRGNEPATVLNRPVLVAEAHDSRAQNHAVAEPATARTPDPVQVPLHVHDGRLCATCMTARHEALRPAPRARVSAEAVASRIRADRGDVFGAVVAFGISYEHACRIRRGWRGAGRTAEPIPFTSRGYVGDGTGHRVGWHSRAGAQSLAQLYGVTVLHGSRGLELRRKVGAAG